MRITWSEPAVADLDAIHDFIARDSPLYATRFVERLIEATEELTDLLAISLRRGESSNPIAERQESRDRAGPSSASTRSA